MILVDTSVWVDHLRHGNPVLQTLLRHDRVVCHPFIIGELACGNLRHRTHILDSLQTLSQAAVVVPEEVLQFIDRNGLMGQGLGYVDVHLLAAARLSRTWLWTLDRKLHQAACRQGLAAPGVGL